MQAIGRQPCARQGAPDDASVKYERHRPERTTLYRLVQQQAATFFAQPEDAAGADLPQFIKDEFDAFLECGRPGAWLLAPALRRLQAAACTYRIAFGPRAGAAAFRQSRLGCWGRWR